MFSVFERASSEAGLSRRELVRAGGLGVLGLSLPQLLHARESRSDHPTAGQSFGRAKNVIFVWLQGGPPQHETFDPKPKAPSEIRGEFRPIQTNVPGIQIGELLPRIAARADKLAIVRSMATHSDLHDASGYWILTGYRYTGQQSRQISRTDWPYLGSVLRMVKPSEMSPAFSSVWLPDVMRLNDNVMPAGQTAGFLGSAWEPHRLVCDPAAPDFHIEGLQLPADVPAGRIAARESLLAQINRRLDDLDRSGASGNYGRHAREVFGLLTSGKGREAFDLGKEPAPLRNRYGRNTWGQSLLLARRLIEAGARLVHVNWPRDPGDEAVNNPMWDTHAQNSDRLQDVLCPLFDVGFTALLDDLQDRGLLEETLVVAIGEFGRTPRINAQGGRDHWGHVFSFALAGAGISGGQVYGSSDRQGAYPREGRLEPQDLTATIVHLLGIDHAATFPDATGRPFHITQGEPLWTLLGDRPATAERVLPEGNLALVPEYSRDPLLNTGFEGGPLISVAPGKRLKGWQASPNGDANPGIAFGVRLLGRSQGQPRTGEGHAAIGYDLSRSTKPIRLAAGASAMLTQEIRNPRAGTYTITVHVLGAALAKDFEEFLGNFRCRLILFGYHDLSKNPLKDRREFASVEFRPKPGEYHPVVLMQKLRSQDGGASEIEMGVGLAILIESTAGGALMISPGQKALVFVDDVSVAFVPRPRNDDVTV